jgi:hypothetical protein
LLTLLPLLALLALLALAFFTLLIHMVLQKLTSTAG